MQHVPVLLHEVIAYLDPRPGEFVIDATIDGGGHAREILKRIGPEGMLLGVDWDRSMIEKLTLDLRRETSRVILVHGNYADMPEILAGRKLPNADGLLADLGTSSDQLTHSGRGFSFLRDEPLLMTYDDSRKPVKQILRDLAEPELAEIIRTFGEERYAGRVARAIKEAVRAKRIETSGALAAVVREALPRHYERGRRREGMHRIDPATRTFQALRIYANRELENLERLLQALPKIMRRGGRAAFISFHSLEDRMVKTYLRNFAGSGVAELLVKKPVRATADEHRVNPHSRSARLRAAKFFA
ncbi:MAG: 16S rRNA (cytosine(1402)-N(4))-methyltransferase RsmH [Candidatus Liptonbacteria bacterium]|nr:16S rRNA (cytosine(1402)-N(4))-methyltransferase RsmH [Candidatus Liptonbacteria bacterium]